MTDTSRELIDKIKRDREGGTPFHIAADFRGIDLEAAFLAADAYIKADYAHIHQGTKGDPDTCAACGGNFRNTDAHLTTGETRESRKTEALAAWNAALNKIGEQYDK